MRKKRTIFGKNELEKKNCKPLKINGIKTFVYLNPTSNKTRIEVA